MNWSYGVVVSISGCDPLDPGSTPGTANFYIQLFVIFSLAFLSQLDSKYNKLMRLGFFISGICVDSEVV